MDKTIANEKFRFFLFLDFSVSVKKVCEYFLLIPWPIKNSHITNFFISLEGFFPIMLRVEKSNYSYIFLFFIFFSYSLKINCAKKTEEGTRKKLER